MEVRDGCKKVKNKSQGLYYNGWIDEFRFSKGIARWTANFTPPTFPYQPTGNFLAFF